MPEINRLSTLEEIKPSDLMVFYSVGNSDSRKATVSALQAYLQDAQGGKYVEKFTTQRANPTANNFTLISKNNNSNKWLILTPSQDYQDGSIIFPESFNLLDGQEIIISSSKNLQSLSIISDGAIVQSQPLILKPFESIKYKYDIAIKEWKLISSSFTGSLKNGVSGQFTTVDGKTITIDNGIVVSIV